MRRTLLAILLLISFGGAASAQSVLYLKLGTFNPKDAKAGFIVGITTGRQVDEKVDFGIGADLFIKKYTQMTAVDSATSPGGTSTQTVQTDIEYLMYGLPIMLHLNVRFIPESVVHPYAGIAGGYELVFSREANYFTGNKDNRFYGGWGWQLMVGGEYSLGSSSGLLMELFYNGATVKRSKGSNELGFPLHEELNFSGFGFRVGARLGGF